MARGQTRGQFRRAKFHSGCPHCPEKITRGELTERDPGGSGLLVHRRCADEYRHPLRKRQRLILERVANIRAMEPAAIRDKLRVRDRLRNRLTPSEANRLTIDPDRL